MRYSYLNGTSAIGLYNDSGKMERSFLPDPGNTDYQAFLQWRDETGLDADPAPAQPFDLAAAVLRARDKRKPIIDSLVGMIVTGDVTGDDVTLVKTAIQQLKDITKSPFVTVAVSDTDFNARVMYLYKQYAAVLPLNVQVAFREAVS